MGVAYRSFFYGRGSDNFEKCFCIVILLIMSLQTGNAQIVWSGLKVGAQLGTVKIDAPHFQDTVKVGSPQIGYSVGAVIGFKVKDRYFLHTEYLYSVKSKSYTGKLDPDLKEHTTYRYLEIPILFTMQFKGQFGKGREFKWFMGAGPNLAYLLGGKGEVNSGGIIENNLPPLKYKIKFGNRPDFGHPKEVYYKDANRVQFGINLGAGLIIEPVRHHKAILDLRYTVDQTFFGKSNADYLLPPDYRDNLRFRNRGIKLSVMYLIESNLNKKSRNKGKSTLKRH